MASSQNQAPNVDLFDAYFRRADLDRDGRISGAEAVAFFQGSGLSKQVLAQIWAFANESQSGFLGRAEFYNALKLVTVAQSKRELTPEIVKAALHGPAASKIPAPQINFASTLAPQFNSSVAAPTIQMAPVNPLSSQNTVLRGTVPNLIGSQPNFSSPESQLVKPPQQTSTSSSNLAPRGSTQGFSGAVAVVRAQATAPSITTDRIGGQVSGASAVTSQVGAGGISPSITQDGFGLAASGSNAALPPRQYPVSDINPSELAVKDSKSVDASGNGFTSGSFLGGDVFSATSSQLKQYSSPQGFSTRSSQASSAAVPVSGANQNSIQTSAIDSFQSSLVTQPASSQLPQAQALAKQNQNVPIQARTMLIPSGHSAGLQNSASSQPPSLWPRMTSSDVQKYTKVFVEVDTDRDGKITGEQARNLFLSWRLPREVLKQVWDLSDQDNDSMLSLREFCIALYLMERHREGRVLPAVLPNNIMLDLPTSGQPTSHYNTASWGTLSGFQQQQGMVVSGSRPVNPTASRPPRPVSVPQADEGPENKQQKRRVPLLEKHLISQLSSDEQSSINSKFEEATEADKKVEELEKEILDSREKIDFYNAKMQELVLYKSRCDNRLNEIVERISSDKHEVEILAKKYEAKYKQVGDIASKLTAEEATFRDIQEKKLELYQSVVKLEQDGSSDGNLQVHADHIQSDLDELVKSLNERCKKYGLRGKPTTLVELPFGWQPGIQEGAADWDEHWDKLEDEGFTFVKELTLSVENTLAPPKQKMVSAVSRKAAATADNQTSAASVEIDEKSDRHQTAEDQAVDNGSAHSKGEDESAVSAPNSPFGRSGIGSPTRDSQEFNVGKNNGEHNSSLDQENIQGIHSDHDGVKSVFPGDKIFDEQDWGAFDTNDDIDSVWGFNPSGTAKDPDLDRARDNFFHPEGLGLNLIKTGSPQADDPQPKSSRFRFDDSVPSTPLFSSGTSPQRSREWSEPAFDNPGFDSFSTHDSGFLHSRDTLVRSDSVRSRGDFDQGRSFPAFDDSGPFGSGPFRPSSESQTPRRDSESWSAF
ncbi:actin cytoskeleton-regulatory complex protein PAN1 isoform X2 [Neltuma alba]|uniref:actin cytoskeleton-regulatory complex protein PAN1 isoform X2 n=1 Tax=Neltuma alba TaxID=207710 RepID=UPI0010A586C8|nr:actin cytoskeleton-regulatory complex protein PAN1-like isoform X2 [Prosopis alba]